ncbi:MAG: hypothetical protein Q9184_008251 [Pyrenodesmia sp. 2 TL-2023]
MVLRSTNSRIKHFIRRSIYYLKSTSRLSAFGSKSKPRFVVRRHRSQGPVLTKTSFFDPSIGINPELIKTHACELLIGYQFKEPLLLWEALQAMGSAYDMPQMPRYDDGNMRLAIVGDRVLDLLLALKWYPSWQPRVDYGKMRLKITSNNSLEQMGILNQLERYINLPSSASSVNKKVMTATLEAIIGATYIDGDLDAAKTVAQNLGFNILDGTIPRASFALRTHFQHTPKSVAASVAAKPSIYRTALSTVKNNKQ